MIRAGERSSLALAPVGPIRARIELAVLEALMVAAMAAFGMALLV